MEQYRIKFTDIYDLRFKVDKMFELLKLYSELYRHELDRRGIAYEKIDDYSLFFDADKIPKEQMEFIKNRPSDWDEVKKVFGIEEINNTDRVGQLRTSIVG